jgi:ABC-type amino acid transport substrate-binding protein
MKNLILLICSITILFGCTRTDSSKVGTETLQDKVITSGTIKAAYTIYYPGCIKDGNGNLKGVFIETIERAAKDLNLKVEWVEEVGWGTQIAGLDNDKYDMMGSSVWANPKRAKAATLSIPLYFSQLYVYTRANETKFDKIKKYEELNNPDYLFTLVDGGTGKVLWENMFPKSRKISLPENTDFGISFADVTSNKADLIIMEPYQAAKYLATNPNSIKKLDLGLPLKVYGNCFMFKKGEFEYEHMLNTILQDLINEGYVDRLLEKYEEYPNSFLRVNKPFTVK